MKFIKYPRRYEWENLFIPGGENIHLAIYADETADPSKISYIIFSATQQQQCVVFVSWQNLLIDALLDEIDKGLINMNQKQGEIRAFNNSVCVLVKNERVAIELLRFTHPAQLLLFCSNAQELSSYFKDSNIVVDADKMDNI